MRIDRLTHHESERLRTIRLRSMQDAPDAFGSTYQDVASRPSESWTQQLKRMATFIAVLANETAEQDVGIVRCDRDSEHENIVWLISMWVAPSARGKGAGDALVNAVIDHAQSMGAVGIRLDVADNNHHAIALYQRHGFEPNGNVSTLPPPREHIAEHQRELRFENEP